MNFENTVELKEFECRFCNNIFADSKVLRQHQKKTNYCLKIQDVVLAKVEEAKVEEAKVETKELSLKEKTKELECQFCNNMFGNTQMLKQHQKKTKYCLKIQETKALADDKEKVKELTCPFCNNQFKTKYQLSSHQTQAKYCLKIQESKNSKEIVVSLITCNFCDKKFSSRSFSRHDAICKKKNEFLIKEIAKLKLDKAEEIAKLKIEKAEEKEKEISSIYKEILIL